MRREGWEWYLKHDDCDYGPLSHRELLMLAGMGKLRSTDRLWAPGFPGWVPASFIPGLMQPSLSLQTAPLRDSLDESIKLLRTWWDRLRLQTIKLYRQIDFNHAKAATRLPIVWLGAAGVVVVIIAASTQNSERSFATGAPESVQASRDLDFLPPLSVITTMPVTTRVPMTEAVAAIKDADAEDSAVSSKPASEENVAAIEEAVPLPDRKASPDAASRNIDTKEGARSVQRRLRNLGYLADDADGTWGPRSRLALKQFCRRARIASASGWDRRAERALFSANAPRAVTNAHNPFLQASF
jgi:uncharacterized protein DUF4339/putative peptidoglycan binding protein